MRDKRKDTSSMGKLRLFVQPKAGFYRKPALYWSERYTEIENFSRVISFSDTELWLELRDGGLRLEGEDLHILTLETGRLLVAGQIRCMAFSVADRNKDGTV